MFRPGVNPTLYPNTWLVRQQGYAEDGRGLPETFL